MSKFLAWLLEDRATHGLGGPPNAHRHSPRFTSRQHGMSTSVKAFGMLFDNDAFDVHIWRQFDYEKDSHSALMIAAEDFRKLALWYLWRWAWGEWFGLRRRLFYVNLHRRVEKMLTRRSQ